jgi:hypothetical protein
MERRNSSSPSPQLKASLKFTHMPRADPVKSGAIFRQGLLSPERMQEQQTQPRQLHSMNLGQDRVLQGGAAGQPEHWRCGLDGHAAATNAAAGSASERSFGAEGASERGVDEGRASERGSGAERAFERAFAAGSSPSTGQVTPSPTIGATQQERKPAHSLGSDNAAHLHSTPARPPDTSSAGAIIRPSPYGRFLPDSSPTPFGVAAWASSNVGQQITANFDALVRQSPAPKVR